MQLSVRSSVYSARQVFQKAKRYKRNSEKREKGGEEEEEEQGEEGVEEEEKKPGILVCLQLS